MKDIAHTGEQRQQAREPNAGEVQEWVELVRRLGFDDDDAEDVMRQFLIDLGAMVTENRRELIEG